MHRRILISTAIGTLVSGAVTITLAMASSVSDTVHRIMSTMTAAMFIVSALGWIVTCAVRQAIDEAYQLGATSGAERVGRAHQDLDASVSRIHGDR